MAGMVLPELIFEDEAMLVYDRPAGMPMAGRGSGTLVALAQARHGAEVVAVHRPETEVGGVAVLARGKAWQDGLSGQFQAKTARRRFEALVVLEEVARSVKAAAGAARGSDGGLREEFSIELPLIEDEARPGAMLVAPRREGRMAAARVAVRERWGKFAWVEVEPADYGPHQTRVLLAAVGAPVLNDELYGAPGVELRLSGLKRGYKGRADERPLVTGLALRLASVELTHPATRERLTLTAPEPKAWAVAMKNLRKFGRGR